MYYIYMLRCEDNSIYTGITTDINRRIEEHFSKNKKCAKYTLNHTAKKLESVWQTENRVLASKLEYHIKKLPKQRKEELILKDNLEKFLSDKIDASKYKKVQMEEKLMNLKEQIENYKPYNEQEEKDKQTMLKYINTFDDVLTRNNEFGHFTASAWAVNKERTKVLMIYHNIYKSWAWTGGHADGESDLLGTAIRELKEETGVENVKVLNNDIFSLEIICVNGHVKRNKYVSSHVHLNLTYLLEVDENEVLKIKEDENNGVKWINIEDVEKVSNEKWMIEKVYQKLNEKLKIVD